MASAGPGPPKAPKKKVEVETSKLILIIMELYKSEDPQVKGLVSYLAGCIIESYADMQDMINDILKTYVTQSKMIAKMRIDMKRLHPEDSKILSNIFGVCLFGDIL